MSELNGLKFPFTVNSVGGVSLVRQSKEDNTVFNSKIAQLLNTGRGERTMECGIFADLDTFIFEPNDTSTRTLLEYEIKQAILNFIPEITVTAVTTYKWGKSIMANVTYKVKAYGTTETISVKVGDST